MNLSALLSSDIVSSGQIEPILPVDRKDKALIQSADTKLPVFQHEVGLNVFT